MSFITAKFHEILLSGFRGVVPTRKTGLTDWRTSQKHYTSAIRCVGYNYSHSQDQRGRNSEKKNWIQIFLWICTSTNYVLYYYKVSRNSVEWFQRSCADKLFWVVSFIFLPNFYVKKGCNSEKKKLNQNFMWICTPTHYVLHNYKVSWNSVERFQSCADKKNRTDGRTDWLTDWLSDGRVKNIIPSATRRWGIIILIPLEARRAVDMDKLCAWQLVSLSAKTVPHRPIYYLPETSHDIRVPIKMVPE